ncbi:MAG: cadherin-like beta sandwich domain-containing protein, partial [Gammaproteobacteria bacterium]|nr:cadherin-like beta sandwich domain-containing protein [Gammaproteobacteria bacterium]
MNSDADGGLFGVVGVRGSSDSVRINGVGLVNVDIVGNDVGGIAAECNSCLIENSYVIGSVVGRNSAGGIVGDVSNGRISRIDNSFFIGRVAAENIAGGLVAIGGGTSANPLYIADSYVKAKVIGNAANGYVGGLIATAKSTVSATVDIKSSFVAGAVSKAGTPQAMNDADQPGSTIINYTYTASYLDSDLSNSDIAEAKTTAALQTPTSNDGIYGSYDTADWHFGTATQYPALKYNDEHNDDRDCSSHPASCVQRHQGSLLKDLVLVSEAVSVEQSFDSYRFNQVMLVADDQTAIRIRATAFNAAATISISTSAGDQTIANGSDSASIPLNPEDDTVVTLIVKDQSARDSYRYRLIIRHLGGIAADIDRDDDGYIDISSAEELGMIRYQLDGSGIRTSAEADKITRGCPDNGCRGYELTSDIDLSGINWQSIGDSDNPFSSSFNGNGHTISNLDVTHCGDAGLFGETAVTANIEDVRLSDVVINNSACSISAGNDNSGALVGYNRGSISRSKATNVRVSSQGDNKGGLVGYNEGSVHRSSAVNVTVRGSIRIGGLVGRNNGRISDSYVANANNRGNVNTGGLVGYNEASIRRSYATDVTAEGTDNIGGLVGLNDKLISHSYVADFKITGTNDAGGLVGRNNSTLTHTYLLRGTVTSRARRAGGLAAISASDATNEYSYVADVLVLAQRTDNFAGGLIALGGDDNTKASYYSAVDAGGNAVTRSSGGIAKQDSEIRQGAPSADIYTNWESADWHFGSQQQYPALRYTVDDARNPSCVQPPSQQLAECAAALPTTMSADDKAVVCLGHLPESDSGMPYCGALVPAQRIGLIRLESSVGQIIPSSPATDRFDIATDYVLRVDFSLHASIQLTAITYSADDEMTIAVGGGAEQAIASGEQSEAIALRDATAAVIKVTASPQPTRSYTINIVDYRDPATSSDIDTDGDGLIEISSPADLNAIRYQLDGSGYRTSTETTKITLGCPDEGCRGYELTSDIDLSGINWQPIGSETNPFSGAFNGNDHTISNLDLTPQCSNVGLFGETAASATIEHVRLSDVTINSHCRGSDSNIAALIGVNRGSLHHSQVTDVIVHGFYGNHGALVGVNEAGALISHSYVADVSIKGQHVGGLVGRNDGSITRTYLVKGTVIGDSDIDGKLGGLVGISTSTAVVEYSYAANVSVESGSGGDGIGGLVGLGNGSTVASYYAAVDGDGNALSSSGGGTAKQDKEIRQGVPSADIYSVWTTADWHFVSEKQYPALRNDIGSDMQNPLCMQPPSQQACAAALPTTMSADDKAVVCLGHLPESATDMPYCGALLPGQRFGLIGLMPSAGQIIPSSPATDRFTATTDYDVFVDFNGNDSIRLTAITYSGDDEMTIAVGGDAEEALASNAQSMSIALREGADAVIKVITPKHITRSYTVNIFNYRGAAVRSDIDTDDDGLIEINTLEELNEMRYQLDGTAYRCPGRQFGEVLGCDSQDGIGKGCPPSGCRGYELARDLDFLNPDHYRDAAAHQAMWTTTTERRTIGKTYNQAILNREVAAAVDGWQPIGTASAPFSGVFDGNGYTISNLKIHYRDTTAGQSDLTGVGLFGNLSATADINNVGLLNTVVVGNLTNYRQQTIGAVAGANVGVVRNSYAIGSVQGAARFLGGLIGNNSGTVINSFMLGEVRYPDAVQ